MPRPHLLQRASGVGTREQRKRWIGGAEWGRTCMLERVLVVRRMAAVPPSLLNFRIVVEQQPLLHSLSCGREDRTALVMFINETDMFGRWLAGWLSLLLEDDVPLISEMHDVSRAPVSHQVGGVTLT